MCASSAVWSRHSSTLMIASPSRETRELVEQAAGVALGRLADVVDGRNESVARAGRRSGGAGDEKHGFLTAVSDVKA